MPWQGEALHWLACALYVACRKSVLPTVGSGLMEGNCVSLTRILRSAKLRLTSPPRPAPAGRSGLRPASSRRPVEQRPPQGSGCSARGGRFLFVGN